jgi:hypothetical protein
MHSPNPYRPLLPTAHGPMPNQAQLHFRRRRWPATALPRARRIWLRLPSPPSPPCATPPRCAVKTPVFFSSRQRSSSLPPSLQVLLPPHGVDLDGPRGGSCAPVGDLSGEDPLLRHAVLCAPEPAVHAPSPRRQEDPERDARRRPPRRRVHVCYFSLLKSLRIECSIAMSVERLLSSSLTCCLTLIVFSSSVLLQVLCSNYPFPQVKRSQHSHSVHVSRLDVKEPKEPYVYFCVPTRVFKCTRANS